MITLALARVRHTVPASRYKGVMLTNPGGPGSAGRYLAGIGAYVPHNVGAEYDWIGIDPRGTGASRPAVSCNKQLLHASTGPTTTPAGRRPQRLAGPFQTVRRAPAARTTARSSST